MAEEVPGTGELRPRASETMKAYRVFGWMSFGLAVMCAFGLDTLLSPPRDSDWVTGAMKFFALIAAQMVTSGAGVVLGLLEFTRPMEERDRWTGVALWANVALAFGVSAWLLLSRS